MRPILQFAGILLVGTIIVIATTFVVNFIKEPTIVERLVEKPVILRPPECPRSFEAYKTLVDGNQAVQIIKDFTSFAVGGQFIPGTIKSVVVKRSGNIACGYLYVKASKGGNPLDEKFDSIYISPQGLGGHLLRPRSMSIPNKSPNATEILLPLDAVPYLSSVPYNPEAQNFKIADWAKLLNVSDAITFRIALSTQNPEGFIEEVNIAYKCWNPETAKETQDCQLSR